jgi:hypothetical protein
VTIFLAILAVIVIVAMLQMAPNHRPAYVMLPMAALLPPPPDVPAATEYDIAALAIRPEILRDIEETR